MGDAERNAALVSANSNLKSALILARQQFLHLEMTMQSLGTVLSEALSLPALQSDTQNDTSGPEESEKLMPLPASDIFQDGRDLHTASPRTSRQSGTSYQNAHDSSLSQARDDPFDGCDYMACDVDIPPFAEPCPLEPSGEPPPMQDISQLGKSSLRYFLEDLTSLRALL